MLYWRHAHALLKMCTCYNDVYACSIEVCRCSTTVCPCSTGGVYMLNCGVHIETMRTIPRTFLMLFSVHAKHCHASIYKLTSLGCSACEFTAFYFSRKMEIKNLKTKKNPCITSYWCKQLNECIHFPFLSCIVIYFLSFYL